MYREQNAVFSVESIRVTLQKKKTSFTCSNCCALVSVLLCPSHSPRMNRPSRVWYSSFNSLNTDTVPSKHLTWSSPSVLLASTPSPEVCVLHPWKMCDFPDVLWSPDIPPPLTPFIGHSHSQVVVSPFAQKLDKFWPGKISTCLCHWVCCHYTFSNKIQAQSSGEDSLCTSLSFLGSLPSALGYWHLILSLLS